MDAFWFDILNLSIRWLHIIAGIAWIGASFYFVMLDTSIRPPEKEADEKRGVFGELWAVHGGGFYQSQKFLTGPKHERLSENLHWSKWEAYTTWMSGFALFILIYWLKADIYLIDPAVWELSQSQAILISFGFLIGGWLIYDVLCRSPLGKKNYLLSGIIFVFLSIAAFILTHTFSGRGAFILFGAMLGTIMVANVFFVIIPGQKRMVNAIRAGEAPNPLDGSRGKQRSVHNTYFTLPVLFTMISNHFAITYGNEYNWVILILISLSGALIRVYFVSRHTQQGENALAAGIGILLLMGAVALMSVSGPPQRPISATPASQEELFTQVQSIVKERCTVCHAIKPTFPGFVAPPNGITLETPEQIRAQSTLIHQMSVVNRVMPLGNITKMTEEERAAIQAWMEGL